METKGIHKAKQVIYEQAISYYRDNEISIQKCASMFNICPKNLSKRIRKEGLIINLNGKQKINSNIFEKIDSEEKAYWLGFMYADGCVHDNNIISLELALKDKEHLQKFNTFLGKSKPIREDSFRVRCIFKDSKMFNDLNNLGVVPRKSLILTFPSYNQVPKYLMNHFIRGYIDGDGSIFITHNKINVSVLGTKEFLESLIFETGLPTRTLYKNNKNNQSNCYWFQYVSQNAIDLINYLYRNATIYLERKYAKYSSFAVLGSNS